MAKQQGISAFWFKLLAIITMTCNHAVYILALPVGTWWGCGLFMVGGFTFPIMAFFITEGYKRTSNMGRYALRLLIFGIIAQAPWYLFISQTTLNVMFTLLIGLGLLWVMDKVDNYPAKVALCLAGILASGFCDWDFIGPLLILMCWRLRDSRWRFAALGLLAFGIIGGLAMMGYISSGDVLNLAQLGYGGCCLISFLLLGLYNGTRGPSMKYFFYIYYPLHLAILGVIAAMVG